MDASCSFLESYCILKSYLLPDFPQDNIPIDKLGCIREKYTYSLEVYVLMLYRKQCLWHFTVYMSTVMLPGQFVINKFYGMYNTVISN